MSYANTNLKFVYEVHTKKEGCKSSRTQENQKHLPEVFCKKGVLKKLASSTKKHLYWILFSIKLQAWKTIKKDSNKEVLY